ncbi:sn-glycerol-3-phosphate ABC transporter ATP-binding protein UgpC [Silvimonas sp.]|uniref:ABC transporter ATP-binding protein n=1 Tax=Silvimonas sp. TaxID=2650811 RepID=UPI0028437A35|nr:sn-glycerol-3-phosphate ABC transporter ATP-binding protein UgpC [Silvimonas sp.]MDR3430244.1 sn-glycerol-3-phosphate ABC transporter ATP-binding protein UgpC [Silvimonas sp.]
MAGIQLVGVSKRYGTTEIIPEFNLEVESGEFLVFLGPSGCGKSTLLRMIAGLEPVSAGQIRIGDKDVTPLAPGERDLAMVFQHYALYPHMTVRENMAFGLRNVNVPEADIARRITEATRMLELESLLDRKPIQLSGGQRQRVAIGRAVVKEPGAFLFDEPLSNLDAALRNRTRVELARLHQRLKTTMVFVTHDQVEAMTLATRIVVLNRGRIEQMGSPIEIYRRPATRFVAGFIGSPAMNFIDATPVAAADNCIRVRLADGTELQTGVPAAPIQSGAKLVAGVRAESLTLDDASPVRGRADVIERLGERTLVHVTLGSGDIVVAQAHRESPVSSGDNVGLHFEASHVHLFDEAGRGWHAA